MPTTPQNDWSIPTSSTALTLPATGLAGCRAISCGGSAGTLVGQLVSDTANTTRYINLGQRISGYWKSVDASSTATGLLAEY